ncbi:MAG: glycyl-radical enzyme activating protein [Thermoguttaceae bacterium]
MQSGLVFNIQRYCVHDGPGIRTTVFLKGCPLRCWWCHNPESQSAEPEIAFLEGRCIRCGQCTAVCPQARAAGHGEKPPGRPARCIRCGACVAACPSGARQMVGRRMSVEEVLAEVLKDRLFYDDSGGGVTFSGGEPLLQARFLEGLLAACRAQGIHTALDTSGYAPWEDLLRVAPLVDLFLYDLKVMDDQRHQEYTGVSNARILANLQGLGRVHGNIWVRVPVIPGFSDDAEQLEAAARLAASIPGVRRLDLLPFHRAGIHKWASLGQLREPPAQTPLSPEALEQTADRLRAFGLHVHTGG